MKSIEKFSKYIQAYNTTIMPNIPIIINCNISNYQRLTRKLRPNFPQEFNDILSKTLFHCSRALEGVIFSYQNNDEFVFVLKGNSNAYNNNVQELISITATYLSTWFLKEYIIVADVIPELIGDALFSCNAFALPNYKEVLNYLIWKQHVGYKNSQKLGSASYKILKPINETFKKKWYLNNEITLFKENKDLILNILRTGNDIFMPER